MTISQSASENLIDVIEAFGAPRPTSLGMSELWQALAAAVRAFSPGSGFDFTGSGSPEGVVTAPVAKTYQDTTNGAIWFKTTGSGNTGWTSGVGLTPAQATGAQGIGYSQANDINITAGPNGQVLITDAPAALGTGNGFYFMSGAADGDQHIELFLGSLSQFQWQWNADGSIHLPLIATVDAPAYVEGAMYYDVTLHKLRIGGATGWETVTSA